MHRDLLTEKSIRLGSRYVFLNLIYRQNEFNKFSPKAPVIALFLLRKMWKTLPDKVSSVWESLLLALSKDRTKDGNPVFCLLVHLPDPFCLGEFTSNFI